MPGSLMIVRPMWVGSSVAPTVGTESVSFSIKLDRLASWYRGAAMGFSLATFVSGFIAVWLFTTEPAIGDSAGVVELARMVFAPVGLAITSLGFAIGARRARTPIQVNIRHRVREVSILPASRAALTLYGVYEINYSDIQFFSARVFGNGVVLCLRLLTSRGTFECALGTISRENPDAELQRVYKVLDVLPLDK